LLQLAALTPKEHEVEIVFETHRKVDFSWDGDIVGITSLTPNALRAYEIADEFRKNGKKVVLGGWHPSALPNEAKQHADTVVIGEAERIWPQVLRDAEKGKLKPFYKDSKPVDPKEIPAADRSKDYRTSFLAAVQATRGCPFGCEFCGISNIPFGRIFRKREVKAVIQEIESIKQKYLWFYDASLTIDPSYTKELFKGMIGLGKKFVCFGNVNVLGRDEELLKLASEAGCLYWFVGFESFSQDAIDKIGKRTNKVENYAKTVQMLHDYGMGVVGSFIFGFDVDTPTVFATTVEKIHEIVIDIAEFTILTPYPGTPLFERLNREGRILTYNWSKYTEDEVVFQPKNMTPEELVEGTQWARKEVMTLSSFFRRVLRDTAFLTRNFLPYARCKTLTLLGKIFSRVPE